MNLRTEIKRVTVASLANGNMLVEPVYRQKPLKGATLVGVFTRMEIAEEIERLLNKECGRR